VDVEISLRVGLSDFRRVDLVEPVDFADLGRDVVVQSLERIIHVTVFMYLPVAFLQILIDEIDFHFIGHLPQAGMLITVNDISLSGLTIGRGQEYLFDDILDLFNGHDLVIKELFGQTQDPDAQFPRRCDIVFARGGALAIALVIFSALNLTKRPSRFLILVCIKKASPIVTDFDDFFMSGIAQYIGVDGKRNTIYRHNQEKNFRNVQMHFALQGPGMLIMAETLLKGP
jgi:hypothetical protein